MNHPSYKIKTTFHKLIKLNLFMGNIIDYIDDHKIRTTFSLLIDRYEWRHLPPLKLGIGKHFLDINRL